MEGVAAFMLHGRVTQLALTLCRTKRPGLGDRRLFLSVLAPVVPITLNTFARRLDEYCLSWSHQQHCNNRVNEKSEQKLDALTTCVESVCGGNTMVADVVVVHLGRLNDLESLQMMFVAPQGEF
ncbi:hypothetical protein E2C01_079775 [Portunus trituberculatus]|uniref:Uncharacterized protein n=1 Tax=Portunus trituberculatus TaxID=210409 RepID=A0A5B7IU82_PORTR|nr:hypothetical protein [Portunus trituberculatus]